MSYDDNFRLLWADISSATSFARNMGLSVLVEVPDDWFRKHRLEPFGRQVVDKKAWLLSESDLGWLWREGKPETRWKEVY